MHFFLWTYDLLVSQKTMQMHFFSTLHPLSTVIFASATVFAFVLLHDSRFNLYCYTHHEASPAQKSAQKCAATSHDFLRGRLQSAFTLANQLRWIAQYTLQYVHWWLNQQRPARMGFCCQQGAATTYKDNDAYWAVQLPLPGWFLSRHWFTLCVTMEVEPRIVKQLLLLQLLLGKMMEDAKKKVSLHHFSADHMIASAWKNCVYGILKGDSAKLVC